MAEGHDTTLNFDLREPPMSGGAFVAEDDPDVRLGRAIREAAAREDEVDSK